MTQKANQPNQIPQPKTVVEALNLQSHFIGIPKITKKNCLEFYKRGKTLQVLGVGFLGTEGRMPTLKEVEDHINLTTNAQKIDATKWKKTLNGILLDLTNQLIEMETEEPTKEKK